MSVEFKTTEKDYFLLVNHPELVERAEELGYQGVTLFTGKEFDDNDREFIKKADKAVVRIEYNLGQWDEAHRWTQGWFEDSDISWVYIELSGKEIEEDKHIKSLQDAVKYFPKVNELEKNLRDEAIINEIDYTDRCGNCHEVLGKDDKYCPYCGTERGKGEFKPFKNELYCVYGPPIKKKYKCTACGYIWITCNLGGDSSKYCPQCGKKTLNTLQYKALDFVSGAVGFEEPFDLGEEPVLFEESQIKKLLDQREEVIAPKEREDVSPDSIFIETATLYEAMRNAGIDIPADADYHNYPVTEKQGEQINLAETILKLQGSNYEGYKNIYCRHCGSNVVASIAYTITGEGYETIASGVHAPGEKDALFFSSGGSINYTNPDSNNNNHNAYICLKCGTEFGNLELPKDIDKS